MIYRVATLEDLEKIWNKDIARHPNNDNWKRWKPEYINYNKNGEATTFVAVENDEPIGQITLIMSPNCKAVANRPQLCDGKTIFNFNAFRIDKEYEGQGHISKLVKIAEVYAKEHGAKIITIGAESKESRNIAIYYHFGYKNFVCNMVENGEMILYYSKML